MSRKLSIKNDQGESIVGILEIKNDYDPRLMLIAHGALGYFLLRHGRKKKMKNESLDFIFLL
jgi:hypothetical protein